jgi:hypothetical protein
MSRSDASGAGDRRGRPASADPPLAVLRARGPLPDRLDAIAIVRQRLDTEGKTELHRVALDTTDDAVVRATAILALAEHGEGVTAEIQPPPAVAAAQTKAAKILRTRALVQAFERGERTAPLASPTLLAAPATGTAIEPVTPDPQVRARIVAAASLMGGPADSTALHVIVLHCGHSEFAVVADRARLNPAELLQHPARPAQLAVHQTLVHDVWTTPFEILTEPTAEGIRIAVINARGQTRFAGMGRASGPNSIAFALHAASEPGATPVLLEGRIDKGTVTITAGRSGGRGPAPRAPRRIFGRI